MSPYEFQNALVAIDGSDDSAKALDCAFSGSPDEMGVRRGSRFRGTAC